MATVHIGIVVIERFTDDESEDQGQRMHLFKRLNTEVLKTNAPWNCKYVCIYSFSIAATA